MYPIIRRVKHSVRDYLGDELIIAQQFKHAFGKKINLLYPQTFNEKIQVLKLYDRNPLMTQLADKLRVRQYLEAIGHGDILNNLLQQCEKPEDIDFDSLPEQFVIKCNHSWDTNIICKNKSELNVESVKQKLKIWLARNHYDKTREWVYKDIKPKIVIERFLQGALKDYKFYCFSGVPTFIQVDSDRYGEYTLDLYDIHWNHLDCEKGNKKRKATAERRPEFFDTMEQIASDISSKFKFCRVDFLATDDAFYFGEVTFYPGAGVSGFKPESFDFSFGERLDLTGLKRPPNAVLKYLLMKMFDRLGIV